MGSIAAPADPSRPLGPVSRSPAASGSSRYTLVATQDRMDSLAEKLLEFEDVPYGGWKDGLFDCCSNFFPSFVMSLMCPCIELARITDRIRLLSCGVVLFLYMAAVALFVGMAMMWHVIIPALPLLFLVALATFARRFLRKTFAIPGGFLEDCCCSLFCMSCVIAQMSRHMYLYYDVCECPCDNGDHRHALRHSDLEEGSFGGEEEEESVVTFQPSF